MPVRQNRGGLGAGWYQLKHGICTALIYMYFDAAQPHDHSAMPDRSRTAQGQYRYQHRACNGTINTQRMAH